MLFNTAISTARAGSPILAGVVAHRDEPKVIYTPDGQVVHTRYHVEELPLADGGTLDLQDGDMLADNGRVAGVIQLVIPYPTGIVHTELLVTRSLT